MVDGVPCFEIGEIKHGWAEVTVRHGHHLFTEGMSDLNDGLGEFLNAIEQTARLRLSGAECRWEVEPGFYAVVIRNHSRYRYFDVAIGYDPDEVRAPGFMAAPESGFHAVFDAFIFVRDVIAAFQEVRERYGAEGYETRWGYPFPQVQLDSLIEWLKSESH